MLNEFLKIKAKLFPVIKDYIYEFQGVIDGVLDVEEIENGNLCITYWRTFKSEEVILSVVVEKSKIELACQGKWEDIAKQDNVKKEN